MYEYHEQKTGDAPPPHDSRTVKPEFTESISNVTVFLGREAALICSVKDLGHYRVSIGIIIIIFMTHDFRYDSFLFLSLSKLSSIHPLLSIHWFICSRRVLLYICYVIRWMTMLFLLFYDTSCLLMWNKRIIWEEGREWEQEASGVAPA